MKRRTLLIGTIGIVLTLAVTMLSSSRVLKGALTDGAIDIALKTRADTNGDFILSTKEIRASLVDIIRGVALGTTGYDINGDGLINKNDTSSAVRSFRRLLAAHCGNGTIDAAEQCDDGAAADADGCSAVCRIEPGYGCTGTPSVCTPLQGQEYAEIRLQTMASWSTAIAGSVVPVMRFTVASIPGASPVPDTTSVALTVSRGVVNNIATLAAFRDIDGDGSYETPVGGDISVQSSAYGSYFLMAGLPVGSETPAAIEIRAHIAPLVPVHELKMKFPDTNAYFLHVPTAAVSFSDGTPDKTGGSVDGYCYLTTSYCPVRIITQDGVATRYTLIDAPCGNGIIGTGETCDDHNIDSGDGCSSSCQVETGYTCSGAPSICTNEPHVTDCGNSVVETGEACDDGDTTSGDGCSATCTVETGYTCSGNPSVCTRDNQIVCGNSVIETGEACDDGDADSGDGCSDVCAIEPGYECNGTPSVCANTVAVATLTDILPVGMKMIAVAWDQDGRKAYLFGGDGRVRQPNGTVMEYHPTDILVFDAVTHTISDTGHDLPLMLWWSSAVWNPVDHKAYIAGGYTERTVPGQDPIFMVSAIRSYDPSTGIVSTVGTLPTARVGTTMVWDSQRSLIHIIGGTKGYGRRNTVSGKCQSTGTGEPCVMIASEIVSFNPATSQSTTHAFQYDDLGTIDDPAVYAPTEDKVYIFGYHGTDYTFNRGSLLHIFDPSTGTVTLRQDLELPGVVGDGVYYDFHAFWDEAVHAVRLFGGTMFNPQYEPGAARRNVTWNYRFDPAQLTFTRDRDSTERAQKTTAWIWDSAARDAYLFSGVEALIYIEDTFRSIQQFSF